MVRMSLLTKLSPEIRSDQNFGLIFKFLKIKKELTNTNNTFGKEGRGYLDSLPRIYIPRRTYTNDVSMIVKNFKCDGAVEFSLSILMKMQTNYIFCRGFNTSARVFAMFPKKWNQT